MGPIVVALTFVGLWLVVGLGIFCASLGLRGLASRWLRAGASRVPGVDLGGRQTHPVVSVALVLVGLGLTVGGLAALVASYVH